MPLITAPVTTPPDTGGGTPTPVPFPEIGFAVASYTDPTGKVWPLTDEAAGWFTLADGVSGLGAAPYALTSDAHPRGGARLRYVQPQARAIVWPLYVYGETHDEFVGRWRALATAFTRTLRENPDGTRTPGVLEIARPDGTRRHVRVFYQEGFEGRGTKGSGIVSDAAALTLWCEDPYWFDPVDVSVHQETGALSSFFTPYPTVSSSQVLGATTVKNPGDVTVWPQWTVTGPASLITFTHEGTGESFTVDPTAVGHGNLLAGQQVTITTDPPSVRYQDGSNWVGALDWPSAVLWGLAPGDNPVTFQLDGSGPGSAVDLTYNPRYETA
ncbi:phage tail protein [Streptomyces sp. NBC_00038]|uniref:phage tail protein n=1 Tax=Streptomyces sp. NBC_00038 TaxID=2903615 RepID=UPI0022567FC9|nr:phage tail protein [Streptomyces sp. NBC_00038]MCX5562711.1 phage tail family protein [Streptomyces sp. NBC_00038]MCX5563639.1 phage tail family protein [Streptomyces sp. NBC_00038]